MKLLWSYLVMAARSRKKAIAAFVVSALVVQLAKHGVHLDSTARDGLEAVVAGLIVAIPVHQVRNA